MTAVSTAVVARELSGDQFGILASAMAVFYLAMAASDFGFSFVLARDLAVATDRGALLRSALRVQFAWSAAIGACMVALALSGLAASDGAKSVILVLAVGILAAGLSGGRQVFLVDYRTGLLTVVDLSTTALTVAATIGTAVAGAGPTGIAVAAASGIVLNATIVLVLALRLVGPAKDVGRRAGATFLRRAVPFGLVSFMSSVYFTIDLALLGWLVTGQQLGDYAVATKVLSLLVVLPGLLMNAALPGLASCVGDHARLTVLASRLTHWMAATALPVCVGAAIFAPQLISVAFGERYEGAAVLTRVLAVAAGFALASNILGNILGAADVVRPLLIQSAIAVAFNIGGNLLLVPRYGVMASAWLTVATEVFVVSAAMIVVRRHIDLRASARAASPPMLATCVAAAVSLALSAHPIVSFLSGAVTFGTAMALLGAWPVELIPRRRGAAPHADVVPVAQEERAGVQL